MNSRMITPRIFLGVGSLLALLGGSIHAASFLRADRMIASSHLPSFVANGLKALWLADSTTLFIIGALLLLVAMRPVMATRAMLILVALIPTATGILIYIFIGAFFAGHMMMAIAVLTIAASGWLPWTTQQATRPEIAEEHLEARR